MTATDGLTIRPATREDLPAIADVPPSHLSYPAVSIAVASGVMPLSGGNFELLRPVSGAEAMEVIGRLESLARP